MSRRTITSAGTSRSRRTSSRRNGSSAVSIHRSPGRAASPIASRSSTRSTIGCSTGCSTAERDGEANMEARKAELLQRIESDHEVLLEFFRSFIRCQSPNPPGDTRAAADHIRRFLTRHGVDHRVIAPNETMPNIIATFDAGNPGRPLALNGHIDVFPVGDGAGWTHDPWGGELVDGRIYGRGACDMKCGTTASIFTFLYLSEIKDALHGKVTWFPVWDEETFGPSAARYLFAHH